MASINNLLEQLTLDEKVRKPSSYLIGKSADFDSDITPSRKEFLGDSSYTSSQDSFSKGEFHALSFISKLRLLPRYRMDPMVLEVQICLVMDLQQHASQPE